MHPQAKVRLVRCCKGALLTKSLFDPILGGEDAKPTARHQVAMSELISCPRFPRGAKTSGHTHQDRLPLLLRREVSRFLRIFTTQLQHLQVAKNAVANFFLLCCSACADSGQMCVVSPSHLSTAIVQQLSWRAKGGRGWRVMARLQTPTRYYTNHLLHESRLQKMSNN